MRKIIPCPLPVPMVAALFVLASAALVSCAPSSWHSLKLSDGTTVRWTPSDPKIGDLVQLELMVAATIAPAGAAADRIASIGPVRDPSGSAIESRAADFSQGMKKIRWSFRVTAAGTWTIDAGDKRQMLWNAATVSGQATELKKFDGESLWHGSKPKALPDSSGAQTPAGAQAVSP